MDRENYMKELLSRYQKSLKNTKILKEIISFSKSSEIEEEKKFILSDNGKNKRIDYNNRLQQYLKDLNSLTHSEEYKQTIELLSSISNQKEIPNKILFLNKLSEFEKLPLPVSVEMVFIIV